MATQANQSSNNSASKKGNRNRSQPRERRDSIKNDTTNHVDHKVSGSIYTFENIFNGIVFDRINRAINNSMAIINDTGIRTIAVIIKCEVIVQDPVDRRCNRSNILLSGLREKNECLSINLQQAFTQSLQNKAPTKTALKIGQDYDFEEAHKKFEDLCLKKVGEEANPAQVFYVFFVILFFAAFYLSQILS